MLSFALVSVPLQSKTGGFHTVYCWVIRFVSGLVAACGVRGMELTARDGFILA